MAKRGPGTELEGYCGKCKLVREHVVVAMSGTRVGKVECRTCSAVHGYRKSVPGTKAAGTKSTRRTKYQIALEERDVGDAVKYKTSKAFKENDLLDHKSFGIGLVTRLMSDNKMEVLFEDSPRLLVHSR